MKEALDGIGEPVGHDATARECARTLAKAGQRKSAIEIAKEINDSDLRDKILAELAQ